MREVDVTVTTDGDDLDATLAALRAAGLTVTAVHREIGIVSGSVPESMKASLEAISGVAAVEEERSFELGPPDGPQ